MKSLFYTFLTLILTFNLADAQMIITGVYDGPLTEGTPKGVELYVTQDIADLSVWGIGSANNGQGSDGVEFTLSGGTAMAGEYIYITNDSLMFIEFFGFDPIAETGAMSINGDDAIELFLNENVVDIFGDIDVDGTDQSWEYLDGWATRNPGTGPDGATFVSSNWVYSGIDQLLPGPTNDDCMSPYPLQSYTSGGVPADVDIAVTSNVFTPSDITINVGDDVEWTNMGGFHNVNGSQATYPDNPESFTNGAPSADMWVFRHKFNVAGVYNYQCDPHVSLGMTGKITVIEAQEPADVEIAVSSNVFTPKDITINVGDDVEWTNMGGFHNVNGTQATYPDNPESFTNGAPSADMWVYRHQFNIAGFYNYQCDPHVGLGMVGTITVVEEMGPEYIVSAIADITNEDADGVATALGDLVEITGVVHTVNFRTSGLQFVVIDETNNGINIFNQNDLGYTVTQGDMVTIQGTVGQFRGLTQIAPDNIVVNSAGNALNTPVDIVDLLSEDTENKYIRVTNLTFDSTRNGNHYMHNDAGAYIIRVNSATGINASVLEQTDMEHDVRGVGGQFSNPNAAPFDNGYQLLPSISADIVSRLINSTNQIDLSSDVKVYPSVTVGALTYESNIDIDQFVIRDMMGKALISVDDVLSRDVIDVTRLHGGVHMISFIVDGRQWTTRFVKQ